MKKIVVLFSALTILILASQCASTSIAQNSVTAKQEANTQLP